MRDPYDDGILSLGMLNVGTRTAYDYRLLIKTIAWDNGKVVKLATANGGNPIIRQGGGSAEPHLDMRNFLDVMALCTTYSDEDGKIFDDQMFITFPTVTRGLTKDKGGGGTYPAASVSPDEHRKLAELKAATLRRELVRADEVAAEWSSILRTVPLVCWRCRERHNGCHI